MAAAAAALTVDECMWCTSETRHQAARRFIVISSIYPALSSSQKKKYNEH